MLHLTNINDIELTVKDNRLCLFYIKAPDCGVCNVMLDKVEQLADSHPSLNPFHKSAQAFMSVVFYSFCL